MEIISHQPAETEAIGEVWGRAAQAGTVIGLSGDLGAGKTQLVKGFARGLDISERVHSPTFTLVNEYQSGRLPFFHLDLYRLETRAQIIGAGLEDYFQPAGVSVIEWIERWFDGGRLPEPSSRSPVFARWRMVRIDILTETERRIVYEDFGA